MQPVDPPPTEWHQPSSSGWQFPFTLRLGAVGAGAIPAIGQAAQGISSGLAHLPGPLSGLGQEARRRLLALGIKGLDAGFGCGVGIGYGFGAGLMLKPSAVEELAAGAQRAAGKTVQFVQSKLQGAGIKMPTAEPQQQQPSWPSSPFPAPPGTSSPLSPLTAQPIPTSVLSPTAQPWAASASSLPAWPAVGGAPAAAAGQTGPGQSSATAASALPDLGSLSQQLGQAPGTPTLLASHQVLTLLLTQQQLLGELHARTQRLEAELLSQATTLRQQEQEAATLRSVLCGQQGPLADQPWCSNHQAAGEAVAGSGAAVAAAEGQAGQRGGKGKRQGKGGRRPPRESPSGE